MEFGQLDPELSAGQHLMLGFEGTKINDDLRFIINELKAGGIILFARNIQSPSQVFDLCSACSEYAKACGIPPLFIAVDQEGGTVARLKDGFTKFKGNPHIDSVEKARQFALTTARELKQAGFNMNLAPVLDVVPPGIDSIMKDRAFKGDAETVSRLGMTVIDTLQENGIMSVAKHFPGIGRTIKDSHYFLPVLEAQLDVLESSDIIPFSDAVSHNVSGIMLSHISYPFLDPEWQASLSAIIVKDLLRRKMGYDGLVLTDDLDMKAIKTDIGTCMRQVLASGTDLALICHKGPNIYKAYQNLLNGCREDEILFNASEKSVQRILKAKSDYLE